MPKLPLKILLRRLNNEEKELENIEITEVIGSEDYCDPDEGRCRELEITTVNGVERLEVVKRYRVKIKAKGYEKTSAGVIIERNTHIVDIYILRDYPFISRKYGAPIRIVWVTPIFHPNIAPGIEAGGDGIVCWRILQEWMMNFSLADVVTGLKDLIERPNPDDALLLPETREATEWFSKRGLS